MARPTKAQVERGARYTERICELERNVARLTADLARQRRVTQIITRDAVLSAEDRDTALSLLREALARYDRTPEGEWARAARAALQPEAQRKRLNDEPVTDEPHAAPPSHSHE